MRDPKKAEFLKSRTDKSSAGGSKGIEALSVSAVEKLLDVLDDICEFAVVGIANTLIRLFVSSE